MNILRNLTPFVATFIASLGSAVVIHEAAHLIAALLLGWKIESLQIGPIAISGWRLRCCREWTVGCLSLRPIPMSLPQFAIELRIVVTAGPAANVLVGLAALASQNMLIELLGGVQLAIGIRNLIPSTRSNAPFGNDGNISFRISKDKGLLHEFYCALVDKSPPP